MMYNISYHYIFSVAAKIFYQTHTNSVYNLLKAIHIFIIISNSNIILVILSLTCSTSHMFWGDHVVFCLRQKNNNCNNVDTVNIYQKVMSYN